MKLRINTEMYPPSSMYW